MARLSPGREHHEVAAAEALGVGASTLVSPAGLPRLATTEAGDLAVAYRCVRRLPLMLYFWDTVVECFDGAGFVGPVAFAGSDGPLEEPSLVGAGGEVVAAWQQDGRRQRELEWTEGFGGEECLALRDHYGEVVWHSLHHGGQVRLGRVPALPGSAPGEVGAAGTSGLAGTVAISGGPGGTDTSRAMPARATGAPVVESRPWAIARSTAGPGGAHDRYSAEVAGRTLSLYWGDLHRHSLISRCTAGDEPELDDFYRYSFDVCEYDFWAVTDHAENTSPYQWWAIQKLADVLEVDGRFVPFYGFEWTSATGHQNVIYDSSVRGAPIYSSTAAGTSTPRQLWTELRTAPMRSLTIPHHPGSAMVPFDWSYEDEEMLRLVEVFQACRGNYEHDGCFRQYSDGTLPGTFVGDGLRRGHRFGLIASSDHGNGASYVGAFATELTRGAVFDALHARRTIAATTRDLVVDFRLNGCFMGGEAPAAAAVSVAGRARGYTDLARVDLVRNGELARSWQPPLELPAGWIAVPVRVEWTTGSLPFTDWGGRLRVRGGEVLETRYYSPEIVEVSRDMAAWAASTRNFRSQYGAQRGGIELTVLGPPGAVIELQAGPFSGEVDLSSARSPGQIELGASEAGRLALQPGIGGLCSLGTSELSLEHEEPVAGPSWYYLRAVFEDGEMAWSSPVWVAPPAGGRAGGAG